VGLQGCTHSGVIGWKIRLGEYRLAGNAESRAPSIAPNTSINGSATRRGACYQWDFGRCGRTNFTAQGQTRICRNGSGEMV